MRHASSPSPVVDPVHDQDRIVVLFVDHVSLLSGGERSLLELVRSITATSQRFLPALAAPEGPLTDAFRSLGLPVYPLAIDSELLSLSRRSLDSKARRALAWLPATMRAARQVADAVRRSGARVVATNSMKAHVFGSLASGMTGVPLMWHMRDCLEPSWTSRFMGLLARMTTRRTVAISDAVAQSLASAGFGMQRVERVYNGLDCASGQQVLRHELSIPDRALLVGTVGQISEWKGLHVLLEALRTLPAVHLAITGACLFPANERDYFERLKSLAGEPDLANRVHLLGNREDIPDVMASLDVLVHPVIRPEPFGRVLVEAMAAGIPVVASDLGATREIVTPECGHLVPPGEPSPLAAVLAKLHENRAECARLGQAGRRRARDRFSLEATRTRMERIYAEVAGCRP